MTKLMKVKRERQCRVAEWTCRTFVTWYRRRLIDWRSCVPSGAALWTMCQSCLTKVTAQCLLVAALDIVCLNLVKTAWSLMEWCRRCSSWLYKDHYRAGRAADGWEIQAVCWSHWQLWVWHWTEGSNVHWPAGLLGYDLLPSMLSVCVCLLVVVHCAFQCIVLMWYESLTYVSFVFYRVHVFCRLLYTAFYSKMLIYQIWWITGQTLEYQCFDISVQKQLMRLVHQLSMAHHWEQHFAIFVKRPIQYIYINMY